VNGRPIVGVFNEDPEEAVASFRKLAELDFDAAFFGHGEPLSRDAALAFRRRVERLA
jgi:glyoxylase-like metal-dependent hydrolase (beta-lactamase superfamily II)